MRFFTAALITFLLTSLLAIAQTGKVDSKKFEKIYSNYLAAIDNADAATLKKMKVSPRTCCRLQEND
ncbi:MAG: hypothetical protein PVH37_29015 [Desulfobacterales bacterium]|jgi:hypothetical protein